MTPTLSKFEFSNQQNATVGRLVSGMERAGQAMMVIGVLLFLYHILSYMAPAVAGETAQSSAGYFLVLADYAIWFMLAVNAVTVGVLVLRATSGFKAVMDTAGNDTDHLMVGLESLSFAFRSAFWLLLVSAVSAIYLVFSAVLQIVPL